MRWTCKIQVSCTIARVANAHFQPCIDLALECFGPDRMMFGSDWPPCLIATSYERLVKAVEAAIGALSTAEQTAIWQGTATEVYGLTKVQ